MPIVLVHGNPETSAIWDEMRKQLDRTDVIALSPPGFGAPVPEGFTATSDAYVGWLALEVQKLDSPVDLVGHDWGGGHVARLACSRPELIRSWAPTSPATLTRTMRGTTSRRCGKRPAPEKRRSRR